MKNLKIVGIYDNTAIESLSPGWGLSILLESKQYRILFDTGADLNLLTGNMKELGIEPKKLDAVVLSHPHCDHVGGLSAILRNNKELEVYVTPSFPESLKKKIASYGAEVSDHSNPTELFKGVSTTGEFIAKYRGTGLPEQGLILETDRGPVLVSGCAHPGIVDMTKRTKEVVGSAPYLVVGGFHLGGESSGEIERVIKNLIDSSVVSLAPTHCTGEKAIRMMKNSYGDNFLDFKAGSRIDINGGLGNS